MITTGQILWKARAAKSSILSLSNEQKNNAINAMADALLEATDEILSANDKDVENAHEKISDVMLDRLRLNSERIENMAKGMRAVAELEDPTGHVLETIARPNGLSVTKISVPMGVVAIIYESRPNVTSDAASLCFKSGNVCVLRSGKEAFDSANAIVNALRSGLQKCGINESCINLIQDTTRASANELMRASGYIDLLIPRGGKGLIDACVQNATVPCIQTGTGICHIYVDDSADLDMAVKIIENAKTSRPSVCNAEEVLLVNESIADEFLPRLKASLVDKRIDEGKVPVELRLCDKSIKVINGIPAETTDFDTEFLDYILAVKIISGVDEAIEHINKHSTQHSEAIITNTKDNADRFTKLIDSACVYVNASTRFTDGGEFGLGCEMGISTQKLHARGPMGLRELTTYKYVINGCGNIR